MRDDTAFVLAKSPRRQMIHFKLSEAGLKLVEEGQAFENLVLDLGSISLNDARHAVQLFRSSNGSGTVIQIVEDATNTIEGLADISLSSCAALGLISNQLKDRKRNGIREYEAELRQKTLADLGLSLPVTKEVSPPAVLYFGQASPLFIKLRSELAAYGTEVVAAFSIYTALDYLHEKAFGALVVDTRELRDETHSLAMLVRRSGTLYDTPIILLAEDALANSISNDITTQVNDIISISTTPTSIASSLVQRLSTEQSLKPLTPAGLHHPASINGGESFSEFFLKAHLNNHIAAVRAHSHHHLTILHVDFYSRNEPTKELTRVGPQVRSMISNLVRCEDLIADGRGNSCFVLLPNTTLHNARKLANRIEALFDATIFDAGGVTSEPVQLGADCTALELRPHHTADGIISSMENRKKSVA